MPYIVCMTGVELTPDELVEQAIQRQRFIEGTFAAMDRHIKDKNIKMWKLPVTQTTEDVDDGRRNHCRFTWG